MKRLKCLDGFRRAPAPASVDFRTRRLTNRTETISTCLVLLGHCPIPGLITSDNPAFLEGVRVYLRTLASTNGNIKRKPVFTLAKQIKASEGMSIQFYNLHWAYVSTEYCSSSQALSFWEEVCLFGVLGLLLYPWGWGSTRVRKLCGENSEPYLPGDCSIGWSLFVTATGVAQIFLASALSKSADRAANSDKVQFQMDEGKQLICLA
ncbi:hypothetical protein MSG28_015091 [Choristoneura fumiferana]|uniref:Uncharacterized protein n=1 Tax=Choristoneura fumiferana TaxID=7141 RepID=A0ACC0KYD7_CHOFU|nr:hypothetical protein MSG28_015091 [Choristoneura fumiferana]